MAPSRAVFVLLVLGVASAGCAATPTREPDSAALPEAAPDGSSFAWDLGNYEGDFAARITVHAAKPTSCSAQFNATGVIESPGPAYLFIAADAHGPRRVDIGLGQRSLQSYGRVQAGPVDETVDRDYFPFRWADWNPAIAQPILPESPVTFTMAARSLEPATPDSPEFVRQYVGNSSAKFTMECDGIVTLHDWATSGEAHFFHEASFDAVVAAHADLVLDPGGAMVAGRFERSIESSVGLLAVVSRGDLLTIRAGGGVVFVTHPAGSDTIVSPPGTVLLALVPGANPYPPARIYEAGNGLYAVESTFASVDFLAGLSGAIVGLEPGVDAFGLAGPRFPVVDGPAYAAGLAAG